ncbi:MAG: Gfo/Idh/MocA family oxidoreductase [Candidatus Hodarchaeota archaeon]
MVKDEIRISVVGTGRMGYFHARLLARLGFLDSVVDINPQIAKKVGQQFDIQWFSSITALTEERSPNGVILAVPTNLHSTIALEIANKIPTLKALLIEKPIAPSVEEAVRLKANLDSKNICILVGHIEVFNPVITRIQEVMKQELLGDLRSILFQRRGAVAEARIESIGDVYEDIGVHDFDVASRLLPKVKVRLFSTAVKINGMDNSSTIVIASEDSNFFATFLMSREHAGKVRTIEIEGTKATLHADLLSQMLELRSLEIARGEKDISAIRIPFSSGEQIKVYGEPLLLEMWNFIDCIKGKALPIVSIDDGIQALKLVNAARQSIKLGEVIHVQL